MPTWPPTVPYEPERRQYGISARGQKPIQSEMQNGRMRMRPRSTLRVSTMKWGRPLKPAELAAFDHFVTVGLGEATSRFDMPVWDATTKTYVTRSVLIVDGMAGISWEDDGVNTVVSMTLYVEGL